MDTKYLGISQDEIKTVEISEQQFTTCQQANGQFCNIDAPLQPLSNLPTCITAICAKNKAESETTMLLANWEYMQFYHSHTYHCINLWILTSTTESDPTGITLICPDKAPLFIKVQKPIHILCLLPVCSATSRHFHLPPHYEDHQLTINISLNTANLNRMKIS